MRLPFRRCLVLAAAFLLLQVASDVWSQGTTPRLSGVGYIDFRAKPRFKVGDWVKYHFTSTSEDGRNEDYDMTILISGRETFWGDECFWVETWTSGKSLQPQATAVLMSYSIFGDSAWLQRLQVYQRKSARMGEGGELTQDLTRRVMGGKPTGESRGIVTVKADTLGMDTVSVVAGSYRCTKVLRRAGIGQTEDRGDSTVRIENWDRRSLYLTPKVPMTSLAREVEDREVSRRAWKPGHSADATMAFLQKGTGNLDLVSYGSGGLTPKLTPVYARRAATKTTAKPAARSKTATTKKS